MTDNWDSYLCEVDGKPASILVDLGAVAHAPMPGFPCLGYVTIALQTPDENGFPRREEFSVLSELEDALESALAADAVAVHIGRCITDGRYELVFYTVGANDWRNRVAPIMDSFPSHQWEAGAHYEPGWDTYLGFLFPGEQDLLVIQNRRLCRQLQERGDTLQKARPINHWLDFLDPEAGKAFCRAAQSLGFRVDEANTVVEPLDLTARHPDMPDHLSDDPSDNPTSPVPGSGPGLARLSLGGSETRPPVFQVRVSRSDAPEHIDEISFTLLDLAVEHGGEYLGWSCPIEL